MMLYRLYLLSPLLIGCVSSLLFKDRKKAFITIYGTITFLFFALRTRYLGSGDAGFYYSLWEKLSNIPFSIANLRYLLSVDLEKGFLLTVWGLSQIFKQGQFVFVFAAIVYSYCLCRFFSDNCDDYVFSALMIGSIGLVGFFLQGLRQSLAISICLLSVKYCRERNLFSFLIVVGIASLFHASALVFIAVYFAYGIQLNWKSILLVCVLALIGPVLLNQITLLANFLMNESYVGGSTEQTTGGVVTLMLYLSLLLYCLVIRNENHTCEYSEISYYDYSHAFFMFLLCVVFYSMRFFYITVFERASYYFLPFAPVAICATYSRYTQESMKIAKIVLYLVFIILAIYKSGTSSPLSAYDFFWNVT